MARQSTSATTNATTKDSGNTQAEKLLKSGVPVSVGKATQFKPGQSGNPAGPKPGYKHLSTHIQEMLNDEEFTTYLADARDGWKEYKGAPVKAIVKTAMLKAIQGDTKAADWLAKYGYGTKVEVDGNLKGEQTITVITRNYDESSDGD